MADARKVPVANGAMLHIEQIGGATLLRFNPNLLLSPVLNNEGAQRNNYDWHGSRSGGVTVQQCIYYVLCGLSVLLFSNISLAANINCGMDCTTTANLHAVPAYRGMQQLTDQELNDVRATGLPDLLAGNKQQSGNNSNSNSFNNFGSTGSSALDYSLFLARGLLPISADVSVYNMVFPSGKPALDPSLPAGAVSLPWPTSIGAINIANIQLGTGPSIGSIGLVGLHFSGPPLLLLP